jgi:Homeodomain-like domain
MEWKQLLVSITRSVDQELRGRNEYLAAENRILRNQIPGRVQLSDGDRQALAEIGQKLGKQTLEEVATIAKPATILAWHRKFVAQQGDGSKRRTALGRPRVDQELEALVVRMARENRSWGYDRIVGALHNLGYTVSDQTVGNILKRQGIPPAPERKKTVTWREFIDSHIAVLGATDFFSREIWTWYRLVVFFLLSLLSFGRCPLPILDMTALRNALWKWPSPPQSSAWRVAVARWIHTVIEHGVPLGLQGGERARPPLLAGYATDAPQEHVRRCRGTVVLLPHGPSRADTRWTSATSTSAWQAAHGGQLHSRLSGDWLGTGEVRHDREVLY